MTDDWTLAEARQWLRERLRDGEECPCCMQFAKIYQRKLNSGMAYALIWLVRWFEKNPESDYVFVNKLADRMVLRRGGEWTLIRYWGLIEEKPSDPKSDQRTSGLWRPTPLGIEFAKGEVMVQKYALTYNRGCQGLEGGLVDIRECLGDQFSYKELMSA